MTDDNAETPSLFGRFRQFFVGGGGSESIPTASVSADVANQLLARAAECYFRAQWLDDAGRVFLELLEPARAAPCLEQQGKWKEAAAAYAQAQQWQAAAKCWTNADQPEEAAECLERAGELLEAAWQFANELHRWERAASIISRVTRHDGNALMIQVVSARIAAGTGVMTQDRLRGHSEAEQLVYTILRDLPRLPATGQRSQILERTSIVVHLLGRPDLVRRTEQISAQFGRVHPL